MKAGLITFALSVVILSFIMGLYRLIKRSGSTLLFNLSLAMLSLLASAATAEGVLRYLKSWQPANPMLDYRHTSRNDKLAEAGMPGSMGYGGTLKEGFRGQVANGMGGTVLWVNNSAGFRSEREFEKQRPKNVLRILSLGDSFAVGYRVAQNETYSARLEEWSSQVIAPTEVLIANTEIPNRSIEYLQDFGFEYNPSVVLLGITLGNDLSQDLIDEHPQYSAFISTESRLGLDKLDLPEYAFDATLVQEISDSSSWFPLAQRSLLLDAAQRFFYDEASPIISWYGPHSAPKMFDPCHGLGLFIKHSPPIVEEAFRMHFEGLRRLKAIMESKQIPYALLLFPQRFQVQHADWDATRRAYRLKEEAFDLMLPNRRIMEFCKEENIICIDPTEEMRNYHLESGRSLYLPLGDMHWNSEGHKVWLGFAKPALEKILREASSTLVASELPERPALKTALIKLQID